jgi:hypothetical protein
MTSKDNELILKNNLNVEKQRINSSSNLTKHKEAVKVAEAKCEEDRTDLENDLIRMHKARKLNKYTTDKARYAVPEVREKRRQNQIIYTALPEVKIQRSENGKRYAAIPEVRAKQVICGKKSRAIVQKKKAAVVEEFMHNNGIEVSTVPLSDEDAFKYLMDLIDDTESVVGKAIFDALGGMTLRTGFWEGECTSAIYALISRGAADVGGCHAESIRFLLKNKSGSSAVLTRADNGEHFKYTDKDFKDLQLVYCPIRVCNSYADVTTMESAFQLLFDFLEVGRHRLWQRSGNGHSKLALRKCDMKYIEDSGDKNPKFMFGITILKNVSVLDRTIDCNGKDIVSYTSGGLGTTCKVNKSLSHTFLCDESQEKALVEAQAMLPPNFMAAEACRKRKAEFMEDSVMRW